MVDREDIIAKASLNFPSSKPFPPKLKSNFEELIASVLYLKELPPNSAQEIRKLIIQVARQELNGFVFCDLCKKVVGNHILQLPEGFFPDLTMEIENYRNLPFSTPLGGVLPSKLPKNFCPDKSSFISASSTQNFNSSPSKLLPSSSSASLSPTPFMIKQENLVLPFQFPSEEDSLGLNLFAAPKPVLKTSVSDSHAKKPVSASSNSEAKKNSLPSNSSVHRISGQKGFQQLQTSRNSNVSLDSFAVTDTLSKTLQKSAKPGKVVETRGGGIGSSGNEIGLNASRDKKSVKSSKSGGGGGGSYKKMKTSGADSAATTANNSNSSGNHSGNHGSNQGSSKTTATAAVSNSGGGRGNGGSLNQDGGGSMDLDDDIDLDVKSFNDVTLLAGVNLEEESHHIFKKGSLDENQQSGDEADLDFNDPFQKGARGGTDFDDLFLNVVPLQKEIFSGILNRKEYRDCVEQIDPNVLKYVSYALQERLKDILEELVLCAQHRSQLNFSWSDLKNSKISCVDVRKQLLVLEKIDKISFQKKENNEKEVLMKSVKNRSKLSDQDPRSAELREKAKQIRCEEEEKLRHNAANAAALAAIGSVKRKKPSDSQKKPVSSLHRAKTFAASSASKTATSTSTTGTSSTEMSVDNPSMMHSSTSAAATLTATSSSKSSLLKQQSSSSTKEPKNSRYRRVNTMPNTSTSCSHPSSPMKRITLLDVLFFLENNTLMKKSLLYYKSLLKFS